MKVGIDLGTTYSAVAYCSKETPSAEVVPDADGNLLTPSVICFGEDGSVYAGETAKAMQAEGKGIVAASFKRAMGDTGFSLTAHGRAYSAEDLSAILLKYLISGAEKTLGEKIDSAVITVPAYFNDLQRTATIRAGEKCGINVEKIINEPTAAAISYGYGSLDDKTVMVYDLGGGTFDITIVRIEKHTLTVLGTDGNRVLGGKDWDQILMGYFCDRFLDEFGIDLREDEAAKNSLIVAAENLKKEFSEKESISVTLEYGYDSAEYSLSKEQYTELSRPLFITTEEVCNRALSEAGLCWKDIDEILLVGGSTRLPGLPEELEKVSGTKVVNHGDTDLAVVKGAALAYHQTGERRTVTDVTSHSLGVLSVRKDGKKYVNEIMIPRNSKIPASVRKPFRINPGNLTEFIELYTLQGESHNPLDCVALAKMKVRGINNSGNGEIIEIEYNYNENGVVSVSAFQGSRSLTVKSENLNEDLSWMGEPPEDRVSEAPMRKNIVIAIDLSRSMKNEPLEKAKEAITRFVNELEGVDTRFALMVFGDRVKTIRELTSDRYAIISSINQLKVNMAGRGTDANPFTDARKMLLNAPGANAVVVLTDGVWGNRNTAVTQAMECKRDGIAMVAVGFGDADTSFLRQLATVEEGALYTTLDCLSETFGTIATAISSGNMGMRESGKGE